MSETTITLLLVVSFAFLVTVLSLAAIWVYDAWRFWRQMSYKRKRGTW